MVQPHLRAARDAPDFLTDTLAEVRRLADQTGLRGYTFEVRIGELPPDTKATCECVTGRAYAVITVAEDFDLLAADEQREALLHEVLHPLLHPLMEHVLDLEAELSPRHFATVRRVFERDLERAIDALASALAPRLD